MSIIETIKYRGYNIEIIQDESPEKGSLCIIKMLDQKCRSFAISKTVNCLVATDYEILKD